MKTGQWLFHLALGGLKSSCSSTSRNTEEMVLAEYLQFLHLHNKLGSLSNEPCCAVLKLSSELEERKKLDIRLILTLLEQVHWYGAAFT